MILLDTSGLLAAIDSSQHRHEASARALAIAGGSRALSPFVLAELDYLLATRVGQREELRLLAEVGSGAYRIESFQAEEIAAARDVIDAHRDLGLGLADASIVVLSRRYGCLDLLTLDERHFRVLRGHRGRPFRLLPADE